MILRKEPESMTKILIVPDIHGRTFWKNPVKDESIDHIVFLGDYLDPYPGETYTDGDLEVEITPESSIENFNEIIEFAKSNSNKVTLLLGNHDICYWIEGYDKYLKHWCRHDYEHHDQIKELFLNNIDLFKIAWECDNEKYGKVLFTHAGVVNKFKNICGLTADEINNFFLKESNNNIPNIYLLSIVSWYRGGSSLFGSPVWADVREHASSQVPQVFQIFGHTYSKRELIMKHFAMLDRGNSCFILTNEGIQKYDN